MPHRVLVVTGTRSGGGAEVVRAAWSAELRARGHLVDELFLDEAAPSSSGALRLLALTREVRRQARRTEPDLVLGVQTYANLICLLAAGARPVLATEHSLLHDLLATEGVQGAVKRQLARRLYPRAVRVTVPSAAAAASLRATLRQHGQPDVRVVPNAIFGASPDPEPSPPGDQPPIDVLWIGRLIAEKRPGLFIEAIEHLRETRPDVSAGIIGDGPLAPSLRASASQAGIAMLGWVSDPTPFLRRAQVLVSTSRIEGFGNVVAEAIGNGVSAVIVDDSLGPSDAVIPGITGLVVPPVPEVIAGATLDALHLHITDEVSAAVRSHWSASNSLSTLLSGLELA